MTHYGPEPLPDRDPTPGPYYPPHDPDADPCRCVDCCEAAWTRQQEADLSEPPDPWWKIDKREMRRRE